MGRALRIEYPGAFYHTTSHGNEQKEVFKSYLEKEIIVAICHAIGRPPPAIVGSSCSRTIHGWFDGRYIPTRRAKIPYRSRHYR
jgi:hypothetical protein